MFQDDEVPVTPRTLLSLVIRLTFFELDDHPVGSSDNGRSPRHTEVIGVLVGSARRMTGRIAVALNDGVALSHWIRQYPG